MSGVAEILDAEITPSKAEAARNWWPGFEELGAFRLVDPEGEVGIEFLIGRDGIDRLIQLPVTYRSEPLADGQVATIEHSVLGTRYVAKALSDPVAVGEVVRVILAGDTEAERSRRQESIPPHSRHRPDSHNAGDRGGYRGRLGRKGPGQGENQRRDPLLRAEAAASPAAGEIPAGVAGSFASQHHRRDRRLGGTTGGGGADLAGSVGAYNLNPSMIASPMPIPGSATASICQSR